MEEISENLLILWLTQLGSRARCEEPHRKEYRADGADGAVRAVTGVGGLGIAQRIWSASAAQVRVDIPSNLGLRFPYQDF